MEQRIQEVSRLRKKEKQAAKKAMSAPANSSAELAEVEAANIQLQEREQALLLAVEELRLQLLLFCYVMLYYCYN